MGIRINHRTYTFQIEDRKGNILGTIQSHNSEHGCVCKLIKANPEFNNSHSYRLIEII